MRTEATQDEQFRGFYRIGKANILVFDDTELHDDPDYAAGVMDSLREAWENQDFFRVVQVDDEGNELNAISGMAGYGGPRKAAEAFARDYWLHDKWRAEAFARDYAVKTNPGRTTGKRRWVAPRTLRAYLDAGFVIEDTGGNCTAWVRMGRRGEPHIMVTYAEENSHPTLAHRPVSVYIMKNMSGNEEDILASRDYADSLRFLRTLGNLSNAEFAMTFEITG